MKSVCSPRVVSLGAVSSVTQAILTMMPQEFSNPLLGYE